jgi:hypothetical protein
MSSRAIASAVLLALVGLLSGCGGEDVEGYCEDLSEQQQAIDGLARDGTGARLVTEGLEIFEPLRDRAPGDVRDEWDTLVFALRGLADAIADAGTTPRQLARSGQPDGVTDDELALVRDAAVELTSDRVQAAGTGIEQHAQDVCGVDLGLGTG